MLSKLAYQSRCHRLPR